RRELSAHEAEENRILLALSEVSNKIKITKTELAEITNEWKRGKSPDLLFKIDADVIELDLSLLQEQQQQQSHASGSDFKTSQLEKQSRITIEDPEDEIRSSGTDEDFNREIGDEGSPSTAVDSDFDGEIGEEPNEEGNNNVSPDTV
ncbi:12461_t:CDS:1, partial [Funneliformis mosseae]